jgi:hypothetical protein
MVNVTTRRETDMRDSRVNSARLRCPLLAILLALSGPVLWATTKGPDAGGYSGTDATVYSFVDIAGGSGGASVLAGSDDGTVMLTMPFTFQFYNQSYTRVCVSSNGAVYFVTSEAACAGLNDFANTDLSVVGPPSDHPAVLPLWSDLTFQVAGGGAVYYQTLGSAPSRRFVIQWNDAYPQGSQNPVTFQAILSEGSNAILFQYKTVALGSSNRASNGGEATIGIRNAQAATSKQQVAWSFGAPVLGDSTALLFSKAKVAGDVNGDGVVTCADLLLVRAAVGSRRGQANYNAAADLNNDGLISIIDLTVVSQRLPIGSKC